MMRIILFPATLALLGLTGIRSMGINWAVRGKMIRALHALQREYKPHDLPG